MANKYRKLREKMSPEAQALAAIKTRALLSSMALTELREALELSQAEIANVMELQQPAISKIEKNTDMYISTLRRYIEAMGGQLEIKAKFSDNEININQFKDVRVSSKTG